MQTKIKFTKTEIDRLASPEKGYRIYWDSALPGFGVRVTAAGVKSFVLQKRIGTKESRITIGRYGALTLEQARAQAKGLLGQIATGGDPVAEKARRKIAATTLQKALDDYLETRKTLKDSTRRDYRHSLTWGSKDWLNRSITAITPDLVLKRHAKLGERSKAQANLWARYLRAVLNYAANRYTDNEGRPVLVDNPVRIIGKTRAWFEVKRRTGWIHPHELRPWWDAVQGLANGAARDYLVTLLLTGMRKEEGLGLRWSDVDLKAKTLTLRDTKNHSDHVLPMGAWLAAMIEGRPRHGEYVFQTPRGRMSNLRYALEQVRNDSGVTFIIHDLRRTFGTIAESLDVPAYALRKLLNHKTGSADVTGGYLQVTTERLRAPMQRIEDYILRAVGAKEAAQVIAMPERVG
ncbi:integrase [Acidithiobacillus caldus]|uniref:Integrase n=1 Tax=Acidithiobacillus caldus TaxID=33059 RepID=A0A1E7YXF7_9PROT|nr:integrase [Acidithiobacillus caldus]